jgi:hemin uptake protein HemP
VDNGETQRPAQPLARASETGEVRSVTSDELLRGQRAIVILHRHKEYRLQVTAAGKLLLTK